MKSFEAEAIAAAFASRRTPVKQVPRQGWARASPFVPRDVETARRSTLGPAALRSSFSPERSRRSFDDRSPDALATVSTQLVDVDMRAPFGVRNGRHVRTHWSISLLSGEVLNILTEWFPRGGELWPGGRS